MAGQREGMGPFFLLLFLVWFGLVWFVYSLIRRRWGWPMSCVRFDGILFGRNLARVVLVDLS